MMQFGNLQSLLLEGHSVKSSTVCSLIIHSRANFGTEVQDSKYLLSMQNYFCVLMELLIKSCQSLCSALQGTGRHAAGRYCISELICVAPCFLRAAALNAQLIGINSPLKCTFHNGLPTVLSILQCFFSIALTTCTPLQVQNWNLMVYSLLSQWIALLCPWLLLSWYV